MPEPELPRGTILTAEQQQQLASFAEFFGMHITAVNPRRREAPPRDQHTPMALPFEDQTNTMDFMAELLNYFQVHLCSTTYCLVVPKGTRR
jgi:hypothetical protein